MLRSELVRLLKGRHAALRPADIETAVDAVFEAMSTALEAGGRVELRGFGAFSVRLRKARVGRNPRTGQAVEVAGKHVPFFKPGRELRDLVNAAAEPQNTPPPAPRSRTKPKA